MLRWGILGTGAAAADLYAPALRAQGHDLAVVGSRSLLRAQKFAANHGVRRARGSYEDVLSANDVDAVLLGLPNGLHEHWGTAALEAGKHVLCPRPLALDGPSAGRMAAASGRTGRLLTEGVTALAHPWFDALVDLVRGGGIGEIRLLHAATGVRLHDPRSSRATAGHGGALLALGVDAVAMARRVAGTEPSGVRAVQRRWSTGVDGTTAAILSFPTGLVATLSATFDAIDHDRVDIVGTQGTVAVEGAFTAGTADEVTILHDGEAAGAWQADPATRVVQAFSDAVEAGGGHAGLDDAVATVEVLDRIRVAAT